MPRRSGIRPHAPFPSICPRRIDVAASRYRMPTTFHITASVVTMNVQMTVRRPMRFMSHRP